MSWHLFGAVVTQFGTAANNRGENEGNLTTLQKLLWKGNVHSSVSAEAIRWAIRYHWQMRAQMGTNALQTNRTWDDAKSDNRWADENYDPQKYIDDDVLGFMTAEAPTADGDDDESTSAKPKKGRKKGTARKRRGALEVTRAVSTLPFVGDITFNARSGEKGSTSLYGTEVHATRYQYGFATTPQHLCEQRRVLAVVDAITALGEVAGNHSRFLYDFSPESIALRWTHDFAPRFLYCFEEHGQQLSAPSLVARTQAGDIDPQELVIGGAIAATPHGEALRGLGATVLDGVLAAGEEIKKRLTRDLKLS